MSKVLSLISGKGGSGKTSIALSMASLLARCENKILLIDADIATNGVTYFYEDKLAKDKKIISLRKLITADCSKIQNFINVNEYFDFVPSVTSISNDSSNSYQYSDNDYYRILKNILELKKKYDVIIFDCQAGYSDILKLVLPISDCILAVMEADAISSSAIRSLFLKVGDLIQDKKVYQVFNKATDEEYDIYSKVSGGTLFTNIETIKFDWKIRKAFSVSQIPDLTETSRIYGEQVYNVCNIIFTEEAIQKRIASFKKFIELLKQKEYERKLKEQIDLLNRDKNRSNILRLTSFLITIFSGVMASLLFEGFRGRLVDKYDGMTILGVVSIITVSLVLLINVIHMYRSKQDEYEYLSTQLLLLEKNMKELDIDEIIMK